MKARNITAVLMGWLAISGSVVAQTAEERIGLLEQQLELLKQEIQELKNHYQEEKSAPPRSSPSATSAQAQASNGPSGRPAEPEPDPNQIRVYWNDGVRMDSANEQFKIRIGGRIMNDFASVRADDSLVESLGQLGTFVRDGTEFRRARLYASGVLYDRFEFKAQYDFASILGPIRDVYVGIRGVPVLGTVWAGHFKEPFALEEMTSSPYITFMERSAGSIFAPTRNTGLAFHNTAAKGRVYYSAGIFRDTLGTGDSVGHGGPNFTGRVAGLPVYRDGGRKLIHLGAAFSHQGAPLGVSLFASRPEAHLMPPFVATPLLETSSYDLVGLEAAAVAGRFSVQTEHMRAHVNSASSGDPTFSGFYVMGSFFLTRDYRPYSRSRAAFARVRPGHDFLDEGGAGAWEIAARYSQLDLNDVMVQGGEIKNFTFAVNWYMNPYSRVSLNYVHSDVVDTGKADIVQMRFALDF